MPDEQPHTNRLLKRQLHFSLKQMAIFALIFGAIGGYILFRTFAAAPVVATLEAERMTLPAGASIVNDSMASGGQAVKLTQNGNLSGSIIFTNNANSLSITARADKCRGGWPGINIVIDGNSALPTTKVTNTSWQNFTAAVALASTTHNLVVNVSGTGSEKGCSHNLYLDVTVFSDPTPVTPAPTISLSASTTSVSAGESATLTWNTTNATSCDASGSWSGSQPTSGSASTGALNATSTYTLSCTGTGGSSSANTTITVNPPISGPLIDHIGVNTPNVSTEGWNLQYSQTILADDGIHLFRDGAGPLNIWSSPGTTPNWSYVDKLIQFVKAIPGGQLLPVMGFSNPWQHPNCTSTPGYKCAPDPAYYQEWSDEVVSVMDHLVAGGVAVPEIEFWNEPYCCGFWLPKSDPSAYMALLQKLAPTVWAKYPNTKILISANYWQEGSTASSPGAEWFSAVLAADTSGLINDSRIVLTNHSYTGASSPSSVLSTGWGFDKYKLAREQAIGHGKVDPHLEITEYGWEANTGCVVFNDGVSEDIQAQYTVDGAKQALATGYVDKVFIFDDFKGSNTNCTGTAWGYNMHRADGSARPVAAAVKNYINSQ